MYLNSDRLSKNFYTLDLNKGFLNIFIRPFYRNKKALLTIFLRKLSLNTPKFFYTFYDQLHNI